MSADVADKTNVNMGLYVIDQRIYCEGSVSFYIKILHWVVSTEQTFIPVREGFFSSIPKYSC